MEKELADTIKKIADVFQGCTPNEIKRMASAYAESLKLEHIFNTHSRLTGGVRRVISSVVLLEEFGLKDVLPRTETTSTKKVTDFNKTEVQRFNELLEEVCAAKG